MLQNNYTLTLNMMTIQLNSHVHITHLKLYVICLQSFEVFQYIQQNMTAIVP